MRVIVERNDGTKLFSYQTDISENEMQLAPSKADVGGVVEGLLEASRFLGVAPAGGVAERSDVSAENVRSANIAFVEKVSEDIITLDYDTAALERFAEFARVGAGGAPKAESAAPDMTLTPG